MPFNGILSLFATVLLFGISVTADGIYTKSSPVLQVNAKTYDNMIARSNHTSILEFYAPWCGHCQNLKPAYEKAAKNLQGLAKVAAINCDDESNKPFCGSMGIQGFPTLKIIQPTKKIGKPRVEDYQGARSTKGIVETVVDRIPNHVKRLQDKDLDEWLASNNETAKVILFTEKGTTSALLRALAIDFLDSISVAQIRNKEKSAVELFGITKFPSLVLLPGGDKDAILYDGEMKKAPMLEFLSQVASPNPDPAPPRPKASKNVPKDDKMKSSEDSDSLSSASSSHKSAEASEAAASGTSLTVEDQGVPTESPTPITPAKDEAPTATALPIPILATPEELKKSCLSEKTSTCILALMPSLPGKPESEEAVPVLREGIRAVESLSDVKKKHEERQVKLFPIYAVPYVNSGGGILRRQLGLKDHTELEIMAMNGKRGWWIRYEKEEYGPAEIERWIDSIRLGEGSKQTVPAGVLEVTEKTPEHGEL